MCIDRLLVELAGHIIDIVAHKGILGDGAVQTRHDAREAFLVVLGIHEMDIMGKSRNKVQVTYRLVHRI